MYGSFMRIVFKVNSNSYFKKSLFYKKNNSNNINPQKK